MAYLRPEVPFLLKFKGLPVGEKHAGKTPPQKVGVGPSSETDTIVGQQGVSRSVGWISCLFLEAFKLTKINPFDWLCRLILKISSEHLPVFSTAHQAKSQHQIMNFVTCLKFAASHCLKQVTWTDPDQRDGEMDFTSWWKELKNIVTSLRPHFFHLWQPVTGTSNSATG